MDDEGVWVRHEVPWPESARLVLEAHDPSRKTGYGGGALLKTAFCRACGKRRSRRTEIPREWRGEPLCGACLERGVRPVTFHATWTELRTADDLPPSGETVTIDGRRLVVTSVEEVVAVMDVETGDGWTSRSRVIERPSLDVWLADSPAEEEASWRGQRYYSTETGAEIEALRNTDVRLNHKLGGVILVPTVSEAGTRATAPHRITAIEDDGDRIVLEPL